MEKYYDKRNIRLTQLKRGHTGKVAQIYGGARISQRMESLGLRVGKDVTMISVHFWRGPVTVRVDKMKIAIGHGMAEKIIVER